MRISLLVALLMLWSATAAGKDYRMVIAAAAGNESDVMARTLGKAMERADPSLTIMAVDQPGASGLIAVEALEALRDADRSFLCGSPSLWTSDATAARVKKLQPLGPFADAPLKLTTRRDLKTVGQLIAFARTKGGAIHASLGKDGMSEMAGYRFAADHGFTTTAAVYKATTQAAIELAQDQYDFLFAPAGTLPEGLNVNIIPGYDIPFVSACFAKKITAQLKAAFEEARVEPAFQAALRAIKAQPTAWRTADYLAYVGDIIAALKGTR